MSNEIQVRSSLTIKKGGLFFPNQPLGFSDTMVGLGGPTPGYLLATTAGIDVDLSELNVPGWCVINNLDPDNFVEVGIREPATSTFYPMLEVPPGTGYPIKLSRNIMEEYVGTGTSPATNFLHIKANTASCKVIVQAFER